jgi:hypothetical protein
MTEGETMQRKTYGRIFVQKEEDIATVHDVIREFFPDELSYMGDDVIAVWKGYQLMGKTNPLKCLPLVYTHKFEPVLDELVAECMSRGVWIAAFTGYSEPLPTIKPSE